MEYKKLQVCTDNRFHRQSNYNQNFGYGKLKKNLFDGFENYSSQSLKNTISHIGGYSSKIKIFDELAFDNNMPRFQKNRFQNR